MIPSGVPTVNRIVKGGSGGPNKDSIPVREDAMGGAITGYLQNAKVVRIVDPAYPEANHYRKLWNGTTQVLFDLGTSDLVKGQDNWCEENGHLYPVEVEPPPVVEEGEEYEVLEERWEAGGKRILKLKKI
jgi:hypothetical protein